MHEDILCKVCFGGCLSELIWCLFLSLQLSLPVPTHGCILQLPMKPSDPLDRLGLLLSDQLLENRYACASSCRSLPVAMPCNRCERGRGLERLLVSGMVHTVMRAEGKRTMAQALR